MQKLIFYTKSHKVELYNNDLIIVEFCFDNVTTVSIREEGYYEVMQKEFERLYPVARLPIANTNMLIKNE